METSTERKRNENAKPQFLLTGYTQTAGIRLYAFESRVEARRIDYTVEVNLALIPGYGIRIQDLPLLCQGLLHHRAEGDETCAFVFTEQHMRSHAEELARARTDAEHRKNSRGMPRA
jgi:hypothetical protein